MVIFSGAVAGAIHRIGGAVPADQNLMLIDCVPVDNAAHLFGLTTLLTQ